MNDLPSFSHAIWDQKYRLKSQEGEPIDASLADTFTRVAQSAASAETPSLRAYWGEEFARAMSGMKFLPGGRILAGSGAGRSVTLFNCFVMGAVADDMTSIFESLRDSALTMQAGGGIGLDFSTLRPSGALVRGSGADASGPVSFMDVWDAMCRTIMSAGARRGAMMACLRCDHPDIEDFIDAKRDQKRLRNFNVSVLVTDRFMAAVEADASWDLKFEGRVYRTVQARALWDRIMSATYAYAEPGVIFIDRVNALNPLSYCEQISATNPCGEQPLPPFGACLLGSINLAFLVKDPFTSYARINEAELDGLVRVAVRFLDNVIDVSRYPLPAQEREARAKRRIGLGVTGLADALILCSARYGSAESVALVERWMRALRRSAVLASSVLAVEKGAFPLYDQDRYLAGAGVQSLDADLRDAIAQRGIRNGLLTSIAPTGTISLLAHNVSGGIEPVFAYQTQRRVLQPDGTARVEVMDDYAYRLFRRMNGPDAPLPPAFVTIAGLKPADHVAVQAAAQRFVDSSISKTVNVPREIDFESFKSVYAMAYAAGCKGCTTYRPNEVTGAVLTPLSEDGAAGRLANGAAPEDAAPAMPPSREPATVQGPEPVTAMALPSGAVTRVAPGGAALRLLSEEKLQLSGADIVYMTPPLDRPQALEGATYKLRWPDSDHAIYITINDLLEGGRRRPFEIFINSKNMEHYAWTVALTRMISAVFRRGGDVSFVVEELQAVFDPRGGQWMNRSYVPSLLAAIGNVIEEHLVAIGFMVRPGGAKTAGTQPNPPVLQDLSGGAAARSCPRCHHPTLIRREGCDTCDACGYSRCS